MGLPLILDVHHFLHEQGYLGEHTIFYLTCWLSPQKFAQRLGSWLNKDPRFFSNIKAQCNWQRNGDSVDGSATLHYPLGPTNLGQQPLKLSDHHQDLSQLHQLRYIHIASQMVSTPERSTTLMIRAGNIWHTPLVYCWKTRRFVINLKMKPPSANQFLVLKSLIFYSWALTIALAVGLLGCEAPFNGGKFGHAMA